MHLNKSPVVIGNLKTLGAEATERWGIDIARSLRHAESAARHGHLMAGIWPDVYRRPPAAGEIDVDEDLYGGFVGDGDRRTLQRLRGLTSAALAEARPAFADARLDELLWRYRARNFLETLDAGERERWQAHCAARLHDGAGGSRTLEAFLDRVDALGDAADERGQGILGALVDYATEIAPDRP